MHKFNLLRARIVFYFKIESAVYKVEKNNAKLFLFYFNNDSKIIFLFHLYTILHRHKSETSTSEWKNLVMEVIHKNPLNENTIFCIPNR